MTALFKKDKLIVILGPTAVGKTALSLSLAKKYDTEIISGDSMLVYKGFDIGAAKPSATELAEVKHHLIDILPPSAKYNVMDFCEAAADIIKALNNTGKIPILAGGTGLYVKSLLEGYEFSADGSKSTSSYFNATGELAYDALVIGLKRERAALYDRINTRVDLMVENGLFDEVEALAETGLSDSQAMRGIGYKEALSYIYGDITKKDAIEEIKKATRHFAKRQFTWYKKMPYIKWIDLDNLSDKDVLTIACSEVEKYFGNPKNSRF